MNHINKCYALKHKITIHPESNKIKMAVTASSSHSEGYCIVSIKLQNRTYPNVKMMVLNNLFVDVILGQQHEHVRINFEGTEPPLHLGALKCIKTDLTPRLFENLDANCKPIVTKSRRHSKKINEQFIFETIQCDLVNGIIEPSTSPWRAQVLVTSGENHRK